MSAGGWVFVALVVLTIFVDLFDRALRLPSYSFEYGPCYDKCVWFQNIIARSWTIAPDARYRQLIAWRFKAECTQRIFPTHNHNRLTSLDL